MNNSNSLQPSSLERTDAEAANYLAQHPELKHIDLIMTDFNGMLRGKRIEAKALSKIYREGVCLPPSTLAADITGETHEKTGLGFEIGDLDLTCFPIPGTLRPLPWHGPGSAQALLEMVDQFGRPLPIGPRAVLQRVSQRLQDLGLTPVVAVELEFFLTDKVRDSEGHPQPPINPSTQERDANTQCYSIDDLDSYQDFFNAVETAAQIQSLPADGAVSEYAPGQFEINLHHRPDAVAACDDAQMLKRLVKGVASQHGWVATFMAKPYQRTAGSGTHIHVSLLDREGRNVLAPAPGETYSKTLLHAIGGLQTMMAESVLIYAPHANSYRRMVKDAFVPLSTCWGVNNRTVALRIPAGPVDATRIEHRLAGADANPYLVTAAVLAGIHYGLVNELRPTDPVKGNAYAQFPPTLPRHWALALDAFNRSERLVDYLGADFCRVFSAVKDAEMEQFNAHVADLEYEWYWRTV